MITIVVMIALMSKWLGEKKGRRYPDDFVKKIQSGQTIPFVCRYKCLRSCKPSEAPYCIAKVLTNAFYGKMDDSFAFAGSNVHKCTEIIPVKELVEKLSKENN